MNNKERALKGALEEWALKEQALEEQALEGTCEERAQEGSLE